jgi:hypothetical protein
MEKNYEGGEDESVAYFSCGKKLRCGERCEQFFFYVDGNNSSEKEKKEITEK